MSYDTVTLLQIEAGARILKVRFENSDKPYHYKSEVSYPEDTYLLIDYPNRHFQFAVVRVLEDVTDNFEIQDGVEYRWIYGHAADPIPHNAPSNDKIDAAARKKLRLSSAISEARAVALMSGIDSLAIGMLTKAPVSTPAEEV
jgi:hypothetical protein